MNKSQLFESLKQEVKIIKHLFSKVKTENLGYSSGEKMRTLEELLRYISYAGVATINWYCSEVDNETAKTEYKAYVTKAENYSIEDFPAQMDTTKTVKIVTGKECTFSEAIVNTSLKYLTAYRMQLFLYLKQLGLSELNTINCWIGMDKH